MRTFKDFIVTEAKDELADRIRQELKKAGYKVPSQISVRKRSASAYDVEIKSLSIDKDDVEKLVQKYEDIDYDERTGEILAGGNTYIFVNYDYDMKHRERERLRKLEQEVIQKCLNNDGYYTKIGKGLDIMLISGNNDPIMPDGVFSYLYKLNGKEYRAKNGILPLWQLLAKAGF